MVDVVKYLDDSQQSEARHEDWSWMICFCMMDDNDTVVGQWHELGGGCRSGWRIGHQDQENLTVVDVLERIWITASNQKLVARIDIG